MHSCDENPDLPHCKAREEECYKFFGKELGLRGNGREIRIGDDLDGIGIHNDVPWVSKKIMTSCLAGNLDTNSDLDTNSTPDIHSTLPFDI